VKRQGNITPPKVCNSLATDSKDIEVDIKWRLKKSDLLKEFQENTEKWLS
jgi:hypothetical protein